MQKHGTSCGRQGVSLIGGGRLIRLLLFCCFNELNQVHDFGLGRLIETSIPLFRGESPAKILFNGEKGLPAQNDSLAG